jgi:hypothetical protein
MDCYGRICRLDEAGAAGNRTKAERRLVECKRTRKLDHHVSNFFRVSFWSVGALSRLIDEMEVHLATHGPVPNVDRRAIAADPTLSRLRNVATDESNAFMEVNSADLDETLFRKAWSTGETLVVHDLLHRFDLEWNPNYFIQCYESERCKVLDCQATDGSSTDMEVWQFFSMFGHSRAEDYPIWKLKVRVFFLSFPVPLRYSAMADWDTRRIGHRRACLPTNSRTSLPISTRASRCPTSLAPMESSTSPPISPSTGTGRTWDRSCIRPLRVFKKRVAGVRPYVLLGLPPRPLLFRVGMSLRYLGFADTAYG